MMMRTNLVQTYILLSCLCLWVLTLDTAPADAYDFTCNLYCYHGGTCRHGSGKFGSTNSQKNSKYAGISDEETAKLPFEQVRHEQGMYCTCPIGYTGLQCEIKYVVCPRDNHTCFNGSTCRKEVSGNNEVYFRCECDPDGSVMDADYAGKYCEHIATVFCEEKGMEMGQSYCTNGGKCKEKTNPDAKHPGCECPDGFSGDHCEIVHVTSSVTAMITAASSKITKGGIFGLILGSIIALGVAYYAKDKYYDKPRRERIRLNALTPGARAQAEMTSQKSDRRNKTKPIV